MSYILLSKDMDRGSLRT